MVLTEFAGKSLKELGVKPGWFCRHSCCSIWFQVVQVFENSLVCVARDPKQGTSYVSNHSGYSGLSALTPEVPSGNWIAVDRTKNFFDKFHPERERIVV